MKAFFFLFIILTVTAANAQIIKNNNIIIGQTDSVYSKILNEKRTIWVYLPPGYDDWLMTTKRYPVVYLLDGDAHFPTVSSMIDKLSGDGITTCPQMIVVAILNTDRTRDLTPTNSLLNGLGKIQPEFRTSGGGDNFASFMEKELMPHIDSLYRTAPYRVLIGHSLGGLTVMHMIINHTSMFNAYIALDPSMWWDNKWLLKKAQDVLKQKKFEGRSLYLAIANTMDNGMDTLHVRKDTSITTRHIRCLLELKDALKSNDSNGLNWAYRYYIDDNHSTVPLIAEYDAFHFLFSCYKMSNGDEAKLKERADGDMVALLDAHYVNISKHMGYKVFPAEGEINGLGYYFLTMNWSQKSYQMFALNVKNYPQSSNAYDSMGDFYNSRKDKAKAIEFYTKSYQLSKNAETKKKLDALQAVK